LTIRGVGTDLCAVARMAALLERHGDRFRSRCFRAGELPPDRGADPAAVAARWAAKEAVLKALGADVRAVPYRDVEVTGGAGGPPGVRLHGRARRLFEAAGGGVIHLSWTHERDHALAFAVVTA
jgi:holo-[acyl-carrier protein] synthase